jgi:peptidoglycan hydrolase CwlO-like protein
LRKKEALHGEQLSAREKQIEDLRKDIREEQDKYATLQTQTSRQIDELENDIREKREALIVLTQKLTNWKT